MSVMHTEFERLLELVSRLYFAENKTQSQIATDVRVIDLYRCLEPKGRRTGERLSQTTINRLLQRAQHLGVVAISVDPSFAVEMIKEPELSKELRNTFLLKECSVLRPAKSSPDGLDTPLPQDEGGTQDAVSSEPPNPTTREAADEHEGRLILGLSNFTARELRDSLQSGDHVLCGGGRTICWLARAVRRNPPSKRDLIFTPLSGRLWVEDWRTGDADIMEQPLDADDAVHLLAEAFENEPGGRFSQINLPLYEHTSDEANEILSKHCGLGLDGAWNWGLPDATRAFVGVGWLENKGHRLSVFLSKFEAGESTATESYLATAGKGLQRIRKLCEDSCVPPPGDIANRLFACVPMPDQLQKVDDRELLKTNLKKIAAHVDSLNRRAVVMSWKHLRRTRSVRAIAAGTKLPALWTVLLAGRFDAEAVRRNGAGTDNEPLISELTTDELTARPLISAMQTVLKDDGMQLWYKQALWDAGLIATPYP